MTELRSMTGFGRASGVWEQIDWNWEIRAVNGKGLDIRTRLPSGFDRLESIIRKTSGKHLSRGHVQVSLTVHRSHHGMVPTINEKALQNILHALDEIEKSSDFAKSTAAEILSLRGVMELEEPALPDARATVLDSTLMDGFLTAVGALVDYRNREGAELSDVLLGQVSKLEELLEQVEGHPSIATDALATKLHDQVARFGEMAGDLDQDRFYQELALLATRSDIREELDRLKVHVAAARSLIEGGSPAGRRLEFLAQELNREINTLCSKSGSVQLTELGLELKVVIDQLREQILNVE